MQYADTDMTIEISDAATRTADNERTGTFKVRVLDSPVGGMNLDKAVIVEYNDKDLQSALGRLERRELDTEGLVMLGRTLAAMLLPITAQDGVTTVRAFLQHSFSKLGPDVGLRLRLRLPPDLAVVPWEYAYVERAGGGGMDGFLALDPRIAIIRHEVLATAVVDPAMNGDIKIVTALAQAEGLPELNLDEEMKLLTEAVHGFDGIRVEPCRNATLAKLQPLLAGAGVFHFSGHGDFTRQMGAKPGTYSGVGFLALGVERVDAEQMGMNLRSQGIRLAVLAGCNTGRRDGISVWSGIAPTLVKMEIPAVVANQYTITDKCAIAFTHQFYQALAGGLPIERAVSAGRIAAYNTDKSGRDWGVPVLYLRAANGQLFSGAVDSQARERCRKAAEASVAIRAKEVKAGGEIVGANVREMIEGKLAISIAVERVVAGKVVGANLGQGQGGSTNVDMEVGEVAHGGKLHGLQIDVLGGHGRSLKEGSTADSYEREGEEKTSFEATRSVSPSTRIRVGRVSGGQVIGTQSNRREGDKFQGNQTNVAPGGQSSTNTGFAGPVHNYGPVVINQGANSSQLSAGYGSGAHEPSIEEKVRLDVAYPESAVVNEPFDVAISVRQPDAPVIVVEDLARVVSGEGSIFRSEKDDIVKYRVEVTGAGFDVMPKSYLIELRPRTNSRSLVFQLVSNKTGKRSLLVNAYQDDGVVAAQTRVTIKVEVAISPV